MGIIKDTNICYFYTINKAIGNGLIRNQSFQMIKKDNEE